MDDLLNDFLTEAGEGLAALDLELVRLEQTPDDPALVGGIFRIVHTIKGTCGFIGLPRLETLAHAAENVLGKFRDRELQVSPTSVTLILQTLDRIKLILQTLERSGSEPEGDDAELIGRLNDVAEGRAGTAAPVPAAASAAGAFERIGGLPGLEAVLDRVIAAIPADPVIGSFFKHTTLAVHKAMLRDWLAQALGGPDEYVGADMVAAHRNIAGIEHRHFDAFVACIERALAGVDAEAAAAVLGVVKALRASIVTAPAAAAPAASPVPTPALAPEPAAAAEPADGKRDVARAQQTIRVNVDLLENLMTMVSELVLTRNQLLQMLRTRENSEFATPLQQLNHITSELQEGVMMTRMQPIGNAWAGLPRIIRDLCHDLGKKIELEMLGAETELDRQVLELIKDPLTHMIRNSGDHGIESPRDRAAAGKPETGRIVLQALHEGGQIIIRIVDDGRGLSTAKIRAKAIANGLATEAELAGYTEQQIQQFIFKAGFSTAEAVTSVSGRGVGMDVVRNNIEKIGGTIELSSREGRGTVFTIKIPLTLAIVSGLIVDCGGHRFAIPQVNVLELVRVSAHSGHEVRTINGAPVLRLRNQLLALVPLARMLGLGDGGKPGTDDMFVIVTQVGAQVFGIVVDQVFDTEEIVVKPISPILRGIRAFSGNTILGDGSVIMILDPNGLAPQSDEIAGGLETRAAEADTAGDAEERTSLLVFTAGSATPKAVPLALVARLEEIDRATIEHADGRPVVQYRGSLMPLVTVGGSRPLEATGRQPVIVFTDAGHTMGLVVDEILDIVEDSCRFELKAGGPGLLGTAVIAGRSTEVVDTAFYLTAAFPDWFGARSSTGAAEKSNGRVLLVDDSPFFRNLLAPLLATAGYAVTTAESAAKALRLCERGERFDVIVSDIEMPDMDGFAFAEAVRSSDRWQRTPLVALSGRTSPDYLDKGRVAGFTDYVPKLDREGLLDTLSQTLSLARAA